MSTDSSRFHSWGVSVTQPRLHDRELRCKMVDSRRLSTLIRSAGFNGWFSVNAASLKDRRHHTGILLPLFLGSAIPPTIYNILDIILASGRNSRALCKPCWQDTRIASSGAELRLPCSRVAPIAPGTLCVLTWVTPLEPCFSSCPNTAPVKTVRCLPESSVFVVGQVPLSGALADLLKYVKVAQTAVQWCPGWRVKPDAESGHGCNISFGQNCSSKLYSGGQRAFCRLGCVIGFCPSTY